MYWVCMLCDMCIYTSYCIYVQAVYLLYIGIVSTRLTHCLFCLGLIFPFYLNESNSETTIKNLEMIGASLLFVQYRPVTLVHLYSRAGPTMVSA